MRIRATILTAVAAAASVLLLATPASAHEDRTIGKFEVAVGFAQEPAYAGQPNAVQMFMNENGKPVTDLTDELQVVIAVGDLTSEPFTFEPAFEIGEFGTPGDYRANFVPSQPGAYTFTISGTFHGEKFNDEAFTSGPKTFADVTDINSASFPQVTSPSNQELATRIDQESARTATAVKAAQAAGTTAGDDASGARTIGMIGFVVGALGLVTAIYAASVVRKTRS
jgi:hypothetical protein